MAPGITEVSKYLRGLKNGVMMLIANWTGMESFRGKPPGRPIRYYSD